jgi:hypothetical protein
MSKYCITAIVKNETRVTRKGVDFDFANLEDAATKECQVDGVAMFQHIPEDADEPREGRT